MAKIDETYHQILTEVLNNGYNYEDPNRKGVIRKEILSYIFRHEFKDGFPAITTKKLFYKQVATELIWFLKGDTNIKYLLDNNCNIWNKDAYNYYVKLCGKQGITAPMNFQTFIDYIKDGDLGHTDLVNYKLGDLGPIYGHQWKHWDKNNFVYFNQIQSLINGLIERPLATEHIVNAWNVGDLDNMGLKPCHYGFQIVVKPLGNDKNYKYGFELHWKQRSCDLFLGIPYNIASYGTLSLLIEKLTGYKALAIQGDLKKVHIYDNSLDAVNEQLLRDFNKYEKCYLHFLDELHYITDKEIVGNISLENIINELKPTMFKLDNYNSYSHIKVEMLSQNKK